MSKDWSEKEMQVIIPIFFSVLLKQLLGIRSAYRAVSRKWEFS